MFRRIAALLLIILALPVLTSAQAARKRERSGLFPIEKNGKWGFIDRSGKIVISPQFDAANYFYEGLACVMVDKKQYGNIVIGKNGYIDRSGNWIIKPQFDFASGFSEGLASVRIGEKSGYIDKSGDIVIAHVSMWQIVLLKDWLK